MRDAGVRTCVRVGMLALTFNDKIADAYHHIEACGWVCIFDVWEYLWHYFHKRLLPIFCIINEKIISTSFKWWVFFCFFFSQNES